ncbi:hypothetical protein DYBT9275_02821 [Dyadobacter sp. CECT 9275]|uniref:RNA polymerase sigma-70 region 4 domain-containing protein n=1 Tax=Dyadobacter helix TaxID=2822344 RepID=A0A916JDB7_9BACT|nr:sigma-70 family RNA polymerase sigma factor [Dyadobacter sp. CECT 9275]CAG5002151.1 hypothetical protein DYBT9275_02821 [Dyadobacter sp. CECT 9275]
MNPNSTVCLPYSTEQLLYQGLRNQENDAVECLYRKVYPGFRNYVLKNSGSEMDAEDCFQEGLQSFYFNLQTGRFVLDKAKISTIVFDYCKKNWQTVLKSARFRLNTPLSDDQDPESDDSFLKDTIGNETIALVKKAFEKLTGNCREVIRMFYLEAKSLREIGMVLGISEDTAKNQRHKCMKKLKEIVSDFEQWH